MAARQWSTEQRERQARLIHNWKPWKHSTGARTPAGKAVSSKNAFNYSCREELRELARQNRVILKGLAELGEIRRKMEELGLM